MKNIFSKLSPADKLFEDELYARVYEEIETGRMDKASQARAIEDGGDDNSAIRKSYVKHPIARIKLEIANEKAAQRRAEAEAKDEENQPKVKNDAEKHQERKDNLAETFLVISLSLLMVVFIVFLSAAF